MAVLNVPDINRQITDYSEIKKFLKARGITYEVWQAAVKLDESADQESILSAYKHQIDPYMNLNGYKVADVINVHSKTPGLLELRQKFLREHTHSEDEVRFFVDGQGLFWFSQNGEVFSVLCQAGDLISVPALVPHWFDLGPEPYVKAIRIFTDKSGWVPEYTDSGVDQRYNPIYT